ncbi:phage shock protein PspC (stress-responsive transcriptional regulator) [Lactobacillus colini]|uniref:Phage shock protein PspC (Stress-responsive transcriptional regulator) n=1 Tax=Lactobacillus colini TaxID=1819254 RepID=A0ABS4MCE6_9LACO|nr:hypothetical protein [Lactobacillus colini]MBP2057344.1 phage shock protein PspC (stress-responsive transcriptional regulator) [Lactobacillus colini]
MNKSMIPVFIYIPTKWSRFKFVYISTLLANILFIARSRKVRIFYHWVYAVGIPLGAIICLFSFVPWIVRILFILSVVSIFVFPALITYLQILRAKRMVYVLTMDYISPQQQEKVKHDYNLDDNTYFCVLTDYNFDFFIETSKNYILCNYDLNDENKILSKFVFGISKKDNHESIEKTNFVQKMEPHYKRYIRL